MKVFISWSGDRSRRVAEQLGPWMKRVVHSVDHYFSEDMERGVRWLEQIDKMLDEHTFGIICVTPGNVNRAWLNFEAGALSRKLGETGRLIPYLIGFERAHDLGGPLSQYNLSLADRSGTRRMMSTLNTHAEFTLTEGDFGRSFDSHWPELAEQLRHIVASIAPSSTKAKVEASVDSKLDELLAYARTDRAVSRLSSAEVRQDVPAATTQIDSDTNRIRLALPVTGTSSYSVCAMATLSIAGTGANGRIGT